jgi:tRNA pseudouridine38-40 synthase
MNTPPASPTPPPSTMAPTSLELRKNRPHRYDAALQGHKLTIAYRGTEFSGWQRQSSKRTVQECLEAALEKLWGAKISLQGSGRTDTGVHALGQIASFNAPRKHNAVDLLRALNANLPRDVRITECRLVSPAFHARFDARGKTYRYLIWNELVQDPFTLDTHWHVPRPLDLPAMRRAARMLLGRHDFASFTSNPGYERESTVRVMKRASVVREGPELIFHFKADGFLYRMVRNLVGALVKVGLGKMTADDFGKILRACRRSEAPATAPACGLYLMNVVYPRNRTHGTNRTADVPSVL